VPNQPLSVDAEPRVSIIIPAFKTTWFESALRSACEQTYHSFEILVCDSSRCQVIESIVDQYRSRYAVPLRYMRNVMQLPELGNTVKCIHHARGHFLKLLHDDDELHPQAVAELVSVMESAADIVLASSRRLLIDECSTVQAEQRHSCYPFAGDVIIDGPQLVSFLVDHTVNFVGEPSCLMVRREDVLEMGNQIFSLNGQQIHWVGDLAMSVKLMRKGRVAMLEKPLVSFRVSAQQTSQYGRDRPGTGDEGHARFRAQLRELGWYEEACGKRLVSVAPLSRPDCGEDLDICALLDSAYEKAQARLRPWNWIARRAPTPAQRSLIDQRLGKAPDAGKIGIILTDLDGDEGNLTLSVDSFLEVTRQGAPFNMVILTPHPRTDTTRTDALHYVQMDADPVGQINEIVMHSGCQWLMLAQAGVRFSDNGMVVARLELLSDPDCLAVYGDALVLQPGGQLGLALRPDFNLDYLLSFPAMMARNWLFKRSALVDAGGFDPAFDGAVEFELILRLISAHGLHCFGHVPEPLLITPACSLQGHEAEQRALSVHLAERGYSRAVIHCARAGHYDIEYGHESQPFISVVLVMTEDLNAIRECVISFIEHTLYRRYELLLVDNAQGDLDAQQWLADIERMMPAFIKVIRLQEKVSRSTAINLGAQEAIGDFLLLLSPQALIRQGDWLEQLLNHALRPEVGIVGAKTVSVGRKITHGGLILGLGGSVGDAFAGAAINAAGYMDRLSVDQNYSAVADIGLMIGRPLFDSVGGLDAVAFGADGADLDLCLRVGLQGYLTVWTPRSVLIHPERRYPYPPTAELEIQQRWLPLLAQDPAYNPNFSLCAAPAFQLENPALSWRPLSWQPLPTVLAHAADFHGCGHYRIIQPFNALCNEGLIEGAALARQLNVSSLRRYSPDSLILQRQLSEVQLEAMSRMKRFSSAFKVYELDDYLPRIPMKSLHRAALPKDILRSLRRALTYVDRFVVSTERLAEAFRGLHPEIRVVNNRLDQGWWADLPASERRSGVKPRVGWAGGNGHTGDLEMIADVVVALADEVDWVFFGMCPERLRPYIKEFHVGVTISRYPALLASLNLDLAVAPVEENLFNQCKSNLRLLEYGICGYPVVCSDVACYRGDLPVTKVKNRFKDWVEAIRAHVSDLDAAGRAGDFLREAVRRDWMLDSRALALWRDAWLP
jgi:GT2 family glycosyltransferase